MYPLHCLPADESGVAAQVAEPLADAQMTAYYISTYALGHTLVGSPLCVACCG